MKFKLSTLLLLVFAVFALSSGAWGQKRDEIKPPSETASLAENQEWLIAALGKHASYKTRVGSAGLSNIKFDGCKLTFTETRKSGSTSTATMGATRTTNTVKNDISIDMVKIRENGITVEDHIYPELQTIKLWNSGFDLKEGSTDGRIYLIVVKHEAAGAVKTALIQIRRSCTAKN